MVVPIHARCVLENAFLNALGSFDKILNAMSLFILSIVHPTVLIWANIAI